MKNEKGQEPSMPQVLMQIATDYYRYAGSRDIVVENPETSEVLDQIEVFKTPEEIEKARKERLVLVSGSRVKSTLDRIYRAGVGLRNHEITKYGSAILLTLHWDEYAWVNLPYQQKDQLIQGLNTNCRNAHIMLSIVGYRTGEELIEQGFFGTTVK